MNSLSSRLAAPQPLAGNAPLSNRGLGPRSFWAFIYIIVVLYLVVLAVELFLRLTFPWDLLAWPESPFLTDMMKINLHRPVYSSPADVNSFVYSPGLEYLTFEVLKPFGLALDIRFCRLVNVVVGMLAALAGTLAMKRLVRSAVSQALPRSFWFISWGLLWLVLSTNLLSDLPHPDNIQALMAMSVFWLCFTAVETRRFGWALATMGVAGIGVFTKQTGAICFLGPAMVFAIFNIWGWRRWCLLVVLGLVGLGFSLWLLWLPESGRLFTLELLSRQPIETDRSVDIINWLFLGRRGALACVALLAAVFLGQAKGPCRRYLICWSCVGIFAAGPNTMAYIKIMGLPNNLCLFEIWMFLLVWPVIVMFPKLFPQLITGQTSTPTGWKTRAITAVLYLGVIVYAVALLPLKRIPSASEYDFGREVEAGVRRDLQAGRKVLVSHGAACLVHCGITEPPLDRCNSALEIFTGNKPELLSGLKARIAAHHYDRIYLTLGSYYGPDVLDEIHKNYEVETVIPKIRPPKGFFTLRGAVMKECTEYAVLKPK